MSFDVVAGRSVDAYGSVGVTAQTVLRGDAFAVTVLHVAAGGEVGNHPAPMDQLMMITAGRGAVRTGGAGWEDVSSGQAVLWRAGEEHTTRAVEEITAVVIEVPAAPLVRSQRHD
ncbi:cupin domain-containing protein [Actinoplanes sp. NPDC049668]|uniref:cupin domain-containing protein n=1 Tax=unclassified Actinoplanes TaxID=2626549 RepID=UPI0033BA4585